MSMSDVSHFISRLFRPSEEALRSMYRIGRIAGYEAGRKDSGDLPALSPCSVQNTEPLIMLPTCPKHGCTLKMRDEREQGNGWWMYCEECRTVPVQRDCTPYRPGEFARAYHKARKGPPIKPARNMAGDDNDLD